MVIRPKKIFKIPLLAQILLLLSFKQYLMHFYRAADLVITPTDYSASLLRSYGIKCPILPISNGIDLTKYSRSEAKDKLFVNIFH